MLYLSTSFIKALKSIGLFLGGVMIVGSIGSIVLLSTNIPQQTLKKFISTDLKNRFNQNIEIGSIDGNMISNISFRNIVITDPETDEIIVNVDKVNLEYSPLKFIRYAGYIPSAIETMQVGNMTLVVKRNTQGQWEFGESGTEKKKPFIPKPPVLSGRIKVTNLNVIYRDMKGWSSTPLDTPFEEKLGNLTGEIELKNNTAILSLLGTIESTQSPLKVSGEYYIKRNQYNINFSMSELDITKWGPYVVPIEGYVVSNDTPSLRGNIRSKPSYDLGKLPFYYDLVFKLNATTFSLPFFDDPVLSAKGDIHLYNGTLTTKRIQTALNISKSESINVHNQLKNANIIDENGLILAASSVTRFPKHIQKLLQSPPESVDFNAISGTLATIPLNANGEIRLDNKTINLSILSNTFKLPLVKRLFPETETWSIQGNGNATTQIKGPLENPLVFGTVKAPEPELFGLSPKELLVHYTFQNDIIGLTIKKADLFNNPWTGKGEIHILKESADISIFAESPQLSFKKLLPNIHTSVSGTLNTKVHVSGEPASLNIAIQSTSSTAKIYNQDLLKLDSTILLSDGIITNFKANVHANDISSNIEIIGTMLEPNVIDLTYSGTHIPVQDLDPSSNSEISAKMKITGESIVHLTDAFWNTPMDELVTTFSAKIKDYPFYGHNFSSVTLEGQYNKGITHYHSLIAKNSRERVSITGSFDDATPLNATIEMKDINTEGWKWFDSLLPDALKPFSAITDLNLIYSTTDKATHIEGNVGLKNAIIRNQAIKKLTATIENKNDTYTLSDIVIKQNKSTIKAEASLNQDEFKIEIKRGSRAYVSDFNVIVAPYGTFDGDIEGYALISHTKKEGLNLDGRFEIRNFQSTYLSIGRLEGDIHMDKDDVHINRLKIEDNLNEYIFSGNFNRKTFDYDIKVGIKDSNVNELVQLIEAAYLEATNQTISEEIKDQKITQANITLSVKQDDDTFDVYNKKEPNTVMNYYYKVLEEQNQLSALKTTQSNHTISGTINGNLEIQSRKNFVPLISLDAEIKDFAYKNMSTKKAQFEISPKDQAMIYKFEFDQGVLAESEFRKISSRGGVDKEGVLWISSTDIETPKQRNKNVIKGKVPLAPFWNPLAKDGPLNIDILLSEDQISILSLFFNSIADITNEGFVHLNISGSLKKPRLNSDVFLLKNAAIFFKEGHPLFSTPLRIQDGNVDINNNVITVPKTEIKWDKPSVSRLRFNQTQNSLVLSGKMDITTFSFIRPESFSANLEAEAVPSIIRLDIPNLYSGDLEINSFGLKGNLVIPLSKAKQDSVAALVKSGLEEGPLLQADIALKNSTISIPKVSNASLLPMMQLRITTNIKEDTSFAGGFLGNGLFAGITTDIEFKKTTTPLLVKGTLNSPIFQNQLEIKEGTMDFFNRSFEILDPQAARRYTPEGQEAVLKNTIVFKTAPDEFGRLINVPEVNIFALTVIEEFQAITTNIEAELQQSNYDHLTMSITGPLNKLDNIKFNHYSSYSPDTKTGELTFEKTYYIATTATETDIQTQTDTQEVLKLLMPEFFQEDQFNSEQFFAEFSENRVNLLVRKNLFRPIEKQISKQIGLYDLRIDYNLGQDLFRSNDTDYQREVGLNMIQRILSDQLFLRVKTNIELEPDNQSANNDNNIDISEIELSYYLLKRRNLSVNYANIRDEIGQSEFKPRVSLRFTHDF